MYPALMGIVNGSLRGAEAVSAFNDMLDLEKTTIQEATSAMIKQNEANKYLEANQKENYAPALKDLASSYAEGGYGFFLKAWAGLSSEIQTNIALLYPEVAALASVNGENLVDWGERFADAIERATLGVTAVDPASILENISSSGKSHKKQDEANKAAEDDYLKQLDRMNVVAWNAKRKEGATPETVLKAVQDELVNMYMENEVLAKGFLETYPMYYDLADGAITYAKAMDILSSATESFFKKKGNTKQGRVREIEDNAGDYDYNAEQDAQKASDAGFVDQLKSLKEASGSVESFKNALASMDEATYDALVAEHEWINSVVNGNMSIESAASMIDVLIAAIDRYNNIHSGETLKDKLGIDMDMSELLGAKDEIDTAQGYMDDIYGGNFDLEGMLGTYGEEMAGDVTNAEEALAWLQERINALTGEYGDYLEQLGLTTDETEAFKDAIGKIDKPIDAAQKALNKLSKSQKLTAEDVEDLIDEYPELTKELIKYGKGLKSAEEFQNDLSKAMADKALVKWGNDVKTALSNLDDANAGTEE